MSPPSDPRKHTLSNFEKASAGSSVFSSEGVTGLETQMMSRKTICPTKTFTESANFEKGVATVDELLKEGPKKKNTRGVASAEGMQFGAPARAANVKRIKSQHEANKNMGRVFGDRLKAAITTCDFRTFDYEK